MGDSSGDGDAPEAADSTPLASGHILTWNDAGDGELQEYDRTGTLVRSYPDLQWGGSSYFTQTSTALLIFADGLDGYIHRIGIDGSDVERWNVSDSLYTTTPFQVGNTVIVGLGVDDADRVYVFGLDGTGVLHVARFNADGSDDQVWAVSPNWVAAEHNIGVFGVDVGREGRYVYAYGPVETVGSDTYDTIYKYDLDAAGAGVKLASIGPKFTFGDDNKFGSMLHGGLSVNPSTGTIAVGVIEKTDEGANSFGDHVLGYDHQVWELHPTTGAVVATHHIIFGEPDDPESGPFETTYYEYGSSGDAYWPMAWDSDGATLWLWVKFEQQHGRPDQVLLCNTVVGEVKDEFWGFDDFMPALWVSRGVSAPGCTVGGHSGDIYAYSTVAASGPVFKGAVYRSDQDANLQEIIPVDDYEATRPVVESMKLNGGNLFLVYSETPDAVGYSLPSNPHPCIKKVSGAAGHAIATLYDWDGESHGDVGPFDLTFDSTGNLYVGVLGALQNGASEFEPGGHKLWLYKLNAAGALQWRKELPTGTGGWDCGFVWLANDNKTLLYSSFDSNGDPTDALTYFSFFDMVKRYNIDTDTALADLFTITSASDTVGPPTAPYLTIRDSGRALLTSDRKLIVTVTSETSGHTVLDSTQGYRGPGTPFLYQSASKLGANFRDSGGGLDSDPDGVSVWMITGPHQPDASYKYLSRYNIASGERTKAITLTDENGSAIIHHPFALCGGGGGGGNPPPPEVAARRRIGAFPAFVY
jgi:hypothetical protein